MANVIASFLPHRHSSCGAIFPWTCREEWEAVYLWMFSKDPALVHKAIGRVAAWKARASVPIAVELTSDLMECYLWEQEHHGATEQAHSLMCSMAITRFINGMKDISLVTHKLGSCDILTAVSEYNIPLWVVTLRHEGTHRSLPPLSPLRSAVEFALSWLRDHYWRPQRELLGERELPEGEREERPPHSLVVQPPDLRWRVLGNKEKPPLVYRLTHGLFDQKTPLLDLLAEGRPSELVQFLKAGHLLHFPIASKQEYTVTAPAVTDLASFPTLEVSSGCSNLGGWRPLLLKASEKSILTRQHLLTALIMAVYDQDCSVETRDYLAAWLGILLKESYVVKVEETRGVEVVQIVDGDEQFIPGALDWNLLLRVAKAHPGYYCYATVRIILQHMKLSKPLHEQLLYLTTLVTLSQRIASSILVLGVEQGKHTKELEEMKKIVHQKLKRRKKTRRGKRGGRLKRGGRGGRGWRGRGEKRQQAAISQAIVISSDSDVEPRSKRGRVEEGSQEDEGEEESQQEEGEDEFEEEVDSLSCVEERSANPTPLKWKPVLLTEPWANCPLGLCPGQEATPTFLDLPISHSGGEGCVQTTSDPLPMGQDPAKAPQPSQPHTLTPAQIENVQHQITSLLYQ